MPKIGHSRPIFEHNEQERLSVDGHWACATHGAPPSAQSAGEGMTDPGSRRPARPAAENHQTRPFFT